MLKIFGGQYYNESSQVLHEIYLSGDYKDKKINNELVSKILKISRVKASKILS